MDETPIMSNEVNSGKPEPPKRIGSLPIAKPSSEKQIEHRADPYSSYDKRALPPTPRDDDSQRIDESPGMCCLISANGRGYLSNVVFVNRQFVLLAKVICL